MSAKRKHSIETEYINSWVETGVYELVVNLTVAAAMRQERIDLVDVNHVLRTGTVVKSDMIGMRGLWHVRGETNDDIELNITIAVVSAECEVELLRIEKIERVVKTKRRTR